MCYSCVTHVLLRKRIKTFLKAGNPPVIIDLELGTWLKKAEERSLRIGNLKIRLEEEKRIVLEKMEKGNSILQEELSTGEKTPNDDINQEEDPEIHCRDEDTPSSLQEVPEIMNGNIPGGTCHHHGGGAPHQQINTQARGNSSQVNLITEYEQDEEQLLTEECEHMELSILQEEINTRARGYSSLQPQNRNEKQKEREKRKEKEMCLTKYSAWWSRIEKEETKFYREVEKERKSREKENERKELKRKEKEKFLRKFYPTCDSSPGGTERLLGKPASSTLTGMRGMGKLSECLENSTAKKLNFTSLCPDSGFLKTNTHGIVTVQKQTSFVLSYLVDQS
jgi:hypothetical protein